MQWTTKCNGHTPPPFSLQLLLHCYIAIYCYASIIQWTATDTHNPPFSYYFSAATLLHCHILLCKCCTMQWIGHIVPTLLPSSSSAKLQYFALKVLRHGMTLCGWQHTTLPSTTSISLLHCCYKYNAMPSYLCLSSPFYVCYIGIFGSSVIVMLCHTPPFLGRSASVLSRHFTREGQSFQKVLNFASGKVLCHLPVSSLI